MTARTLLNPARSLGTALATLALLVFVVAGCGDGGSAALSESTTEATTLLPASSAFVSMIDFNHIRDNSPEGSELFDRFSMDDTDGAEARERLEAMGVDIDEDIHRVYLGGSVDDNEPVILVYGSFDADAINTYIQEEMEGGDMADDVTMTTVRNRTVFSGMNNAAEEPFAATVASSTLVVMGRESTVGDVLARLDGEDRESLADTPEKMDLIRKAATGKSGWLTVMNIADNDMLNPSGDSDMARLASVVRSATAAMTFTDGGALDTRVSLKAADGASAADIADLTRGLVGLAKRQVKEERDLRDVLESVSVEDQGDEVEVTARISKQVMERRMEDVVPRGSASTQASASF